MIEYSQGEWKARKSPLGDWGIVSGQELICREARHYNAHLIAAAPKLLKACEILASCGVVVDGRVVERIMPSSSDLLYAHELIQTLDL